MNNLKFSMWLQSCLSIVLILAMFSCDGGNEDIKRVPDCDKSIIFKIGDLDTPEIMDGGEINFRNKSDVDSLQLILAKGDVGKAILKTEMPRFYFDFGDGSVDSTNESLEVRHVYKVKEGEDVSTYQARLIFFNKDIPCEAKPIEIIVKRKPVVPDVVSAKIKVSKSRIYEGQTVELEEFGNGTFAWEWYEGTTMIGRGQKLSYTPSSKGVKNISCKVNNAQGSHISITPEKLEVVVIRKPNPVSPQPIKPIVGGGKKTDPKPLLDPPLPSSAKFEGIILPALAKDIERKLNFDLDKRADFTKQVNTVLEGYKSKYPEFEDKLLSSKILIKDLVSTSDPATTLSSLRNQISSAEDVARLFKGAKVRAEEGKLKIVRQ